MASWSPQATAVSISWLIVYTVPAFYLYIKMCVIYISKWHRGVHRPQQCLSADSLCIRYLHYVCTNIYMHTHTNTHTHTCKHTHSPGGKARSCLDLNSPQYTATHNHALQISATHCNTLRRIATHCNVLQRTATHCKALQRTAKHCNALQRTATHCNALQRTATHCNALQCTAMHCNALQCTATHCNALQRTATQCNASKHTPTYCNALQRTASHYTALQRAIKALLHTGMGWLRFVGSLKWYVSFAKEPYNRDDILQKRPVILRSLLIVATPYQGRRQGALQAQLAATRCKAQQHTAMHCNAMQRTATHCNVLQRTATYCYTQVQARKQEAVQARTRCNTLQRTATHCNARQHTSTREKARNCPGTNLPQYTATHTHCNAMQRTTTHYNALQHNAMHQNTAAHRYQERKQEAVQTQTRRVSEKSPGPPCGSWTAAPIYIHIIYTYEKICI